jgi:hypothetical protein
MKPVKQQIEAKYSQRDTSKLFEYTDLIQKCYTGHSHEESLDENKRPIKHGFAEIYSEGMEHLSLSKSPRKIKYSYSKGKARRKGDSKVLNGVYGENHLNSYNFKKKRSLDHKPNSGSSYVLKRTSIGNGTGVRENGERIYKINPSNRGKDYSYREDTRRSRFDPQRKMISKRVITDRYTIPKTVNNQYGVMDPVQNQRQMTKNQNIPNHQPNQEFGNLQSKKNENQ